MKERWIKRIIDSLAAFAIIAVIPTLAFTSNEIEKAINDGTWCKRNNDEK